MHVCYSNNKLKQKITSKTVGLVAEVCLQCTKKQKRVRTVRC